MRHMSFALTTPQILARTKTVTRRVGWAFLRPGTLIQAIEKGQGLKKGQKVRKLAVLRVERVDLEWMSDFAGRPDALQECAREGFPHLTPAEFSAFFRSTHPDPGADDLLVTRIEFSYELPQGEIDAHARAIKAAVEACLPEDEPDTVSFWVYRKAATVMARRLGPGPIR